MDRSDIEKEVAAHYTRGNVTERLLAVLGLQDAAPGSVSIETLFPADQLHHGGVGLTKKMADVAGVTSDMKILDAGSGLGGSARYLVDRFGCEVEAIDLSEEYVQTASDLDNLVGLSGKINHRAGSVIELPYDANSFDLVWSQNVTMNVADKKAMFAEAFRVLRPGGTYVLTHIGKGNDQEIDYPLPWAMTDATSFAVPPSEIIHAISDAGFKNIEDHAKNAPPPPPPSSVAEPIDAPAMGDDMPLRRANTAKAVENGRLIPMLVTATRN